MAKLVGSCDAESGVVFESEGLPELGGDVNAFPYLVLNVVVIRPLMTTISADLK